MGRTQPGLGLPALGWDCPSSSCAGLRLTAHVESPCPPPVTLPVSHRLSVRGEGTTGTLLCSSARAWSDRTLKLKEGGVRWDIGKESLLSATTQGRSELSPWPSNESMGVQVCPGCPAGTRPGLLHAPGLLHVSKCLLKDFLPPHWVCSSLGSVVGGSQPSQLT